MTPVQRVSSAQLRSSGTTPTASPEPVSVSTEVELGKEMKGPNASCLAPSTKLVGTARNVSWGWMRTQLVSPTIDADAGSASLSGKGSASRRRSLVNFVQSMRNAHRCLIPTVSWIKGLGNKCADVGMGTKWTGTIV